MRNRYSLTNGAGTQELSAWVRDQGLDPRTIPQVGTYVEQQSDGTWVLSYSPFILGDDGHKIRLEHPAGDHVFRRGPLAVQLVTPPPEHLLG